MLLHLLVFAPFVAAILMVLNSKEDFKASTHMAILFGIVFAGMSVALVANGNMATTPVEWFHIPGCKGPAYYYLYSHGLGAWMVFLSCGLSLVALISARGHLDKNYRNFAIGIFALMGAMNGTFLAADAVLFFFFFEAMVIPAALLIAGFGGEKRKQAAMTFAIYTLVGSAPMMVALWYLLTIADNSLVLSIVLAVQTMPQSAQLLVFLSFLLAFLVKTPIFPFHGWQAITYSEAPAPLSAILTGAMSKAGVFGFIAWMLPIFTLDVPQIMTVLWLGLITAIYGALMALRATDGKKLLAYSSMSHLGIAVAGVFSFSESMLTAVLVLLVAHGISAGVQYFLLGVAERMTGTRNIEEMGGLSHTNPVFGFLFGAAGVLALAVPGTAGFIGEFGVLLSVWDMNPFCAGVVGFCMILSAAYMLRFIQKVIFGTPAREYKEGPRASALEGFAYGVMLLLLLVFGFHPAFVTNALRDLNDSTEQTAAIDEEAAVDEALPDALPVEDEEAVEAEPLESHIATSADVAQLDSSLTAAGFSEEEKKELIRQVIETEANMAKATAAALEKEQSAQPTVKDEEASND
ncbi:NuoM family protein [Fibrobacter sp. UBA3629]|uniref:complex I subunit 4 family protein n=1 Tax=Fibrobacter sp. UBA3629 TaxID=1946530 RepID=UPI0025C4797E|nr:NADH-quinone oxidoreductase subunit M [Fibrobacter sp. UBA3629]